MLAELRLPFPAVTVYFGADLEFDPAFLRWSGGLDEPARQFPAQVAQAAYGGEPPSVAMTDLINRIRTLGGYLTGITMFANTHGGLVDEALFVVATNPDPSFPDGRAKDRARGAIHGRLSCSTLRRWSPTWRWRCSGAHSSSHLPGLGCRPIRTCGPGARPPTPAAFDERTPRCPGRGPGPGHRTDPQRGTGRPERGPPRHPRGAPAPGHWRRVRVGPGLTGTTRAAGSLLPSSTRVVRRCRGCPSIASPSRRPPVERWRSPRTPDGCPRCGRLTAAGSPRSELLTFPDTVAVNLQRRCSA
jgi:hypothetical protein